MKYNWNWGIFWELSPDATGTYLATLFQGLRWTIATGLSAWLMALVLGSLIGTLRTVRNPTVVRLGDAYVELFRNMPILVQMFLWFFVVPELLPTGLGTWVKQLPNSSFWTAVFALGFFTSARVAEQVKAGIRAQPRGQTMAATALGMTTAQTYRHVLLPMAFRLILPPLTSEFMNVMKNSAVALTIGLMELTARARAMQEFSFQVFEAFTAATLLYLALNLAIVLFMRRLERFVAVPGFTAARDAVAAAH
ncbi:amino acid ABC transporter permease [Propionivibrio dicarboxylicus]|uniref:L-glutamate ABC transporter membrane protein/L-aspartate ABC transporter membrane protein n=1 Tax=Propionivibrio dicarboxylicus TaxID=83767 RepID=A0A1G8BPW8_9RHOO|nr:amino acid ABC transporter permease [Propionivibrio dicarboxylicus]SDH35242.1 L-glutamate ABC transporter membrane protein/L-aspartate ABC transporter membrane protein [Propionivibrio dicarboxylicus]